MVQYELRGGVGSLSNVILGLEIGVSFLAAYCTSYLLQ